MSHSNRLIDETSPYLLQHSHNPVAWQPWDEVALSEARQLDRAILLSIGYSACHWCHVMERESFEDPGIAKLMNDNFICIKVDREERPDIDAIYMDAVQAMTGHGGWPMTMFLTPDGVPFYGGTYFPPEDRHGLPAFRKVLGAIADAWKNQRNEIETQGKQLIERIDSMGRAKPSTEPLTNSLLTHAAAHLAEEFDATYGGFGTAPKFPQAPVLEFIAKVARLDLGRSREMLNTTLQRMAHGGIYDQLGGGFARYSVDPTWLIPHFEKMLYDNAQLARVYTHAWQLTRSQGYKRIAIETLEYLARDMIDDQGFFSSEDADSEGIEGKFYLWSYEEFMSVAPEAAEHYGVTPQGNFENANILISKADDQPEDARRKLLEARSRRTRPARDEKQLTSWNGLAITALAEAGAAFGRRDFIDLAEKAATEVLKNIYRDRTLRHSFKDGVAKINGLLEDYAYLADGLWALWEATLDGGWLTVCRQLVETMIERFWDGTDGGFFTTADDHERLIVRQKEIVESAYPSPNGIACLLLLKLSVLLDDRDFGEKAEQILRIAHPFMARAPQASSTFLMALDLWLAGADEVAVVGDRSSPEARAMMRSIYESYLPNRVIVAPTEGLQSPLLEGREDSEGFTVYVCKDYVCKQPASDLETLGEILSDIHH